MTKYILCFFIFFSAAAFSQDEECESAVDAASRVNPNEGKNCDYSNTGLNGVLHRALAKKKSEEKSLEPTTSSASSVSALNAISTESVKPLPEKASFGGVEFSSAAQLELVRYELIKQAGKACEKGFVVQGERYMPTKEKLMRLELLYYCL